MIFCPFSVGRGALGRGIRFIFRARGQKFNHRTLAMLKVGDSFFPPRGCLLSQPRRGTHLISPQKFKFPLLRRRREKIPPMIESEECVVLSHVSMHFSGGGGNPSEWVSTCCIVEKGITLHSPFLLYPPISPLGDIFCVSLRLSPPLSLNWRKPFFVTEAEAAFFGGETEVRLRLLFPSPAHIPPNWHPKSTPPKQPTQKLRRRPKEADATAGVTLKRFSILCGKKQRP